MKRDVVREVEAKIAAEATDARRVLELAIKQPFRFNENYRMARSPSRTG